MSSMNADKEYPTRFQRAVCWAALTGVGMVTLGCIICGLLYGFITVFVALRTVFLPVIIAAVIAILLHPCVNFVDRYIKKRTCSIFIILGAFTVVLSAFVCTTAPAFISQADYLISHRSEIAQQTVEGINNIIQDNEWAQQTIDFFYNRALQDVQNAPDASATIKSQLEAAKTYQEKGGALLVFNSERITDIAVNWLSSGYTALSKAASYLLGFALIPFFVFYFLQKSGSIKKHWQEALPLRDGRFKTLLVTTINDLKERIITYVRTQMLISIIDGCLIGIGLTCLRLPGAFPLACMAALLGLIPYIGTTLTCIPAMIIAWSFTHELSHVLMVLGIFIFVSQLDGFIIQPKLLGKKLRMHDLVIMFSMLFWGTLLGGVVGVLLAVPLTITVQKICSIIKGEVSTKLMSESTAEKQSAAAAQTPPPRSTLQLIIGMPKALYKWVMK